jgi:hypothetical protein
LGTIGGVGGAALGVATANVVEAAADATKHEMGRLSKAIGSIFIGIATVINPSGTTRVTPLQLGLDSK